MKRQIRLYVYYVRKYCFSQRTVNDWDKLSADCIHSGSINMFKNKINNYLVSRFQFRIQLCRMQFQLKLQFQLWQFNSNSNYGNSNSIPIMAIPIQCIFHWWQFQFQWWQFQFNSNSGIGIGNKFQFRSGIDPGSAWHTLPIPTMAWTNQLQRLTILWRVLQCLCEGISCGTTHKTSQT